MKADDAINRMRIASPCSVGWENMRGDERVRFCRECQLHVYNISEMTSREVSALIASTEGRICARLYKRADGTVLTKDCPVGLRAVRRRASRIAGAALTALLSLCTVAVGQSRKQEDKSCEIADVRVKRETAKDKRQAVVGMLMDASGAVIMTGKVTLINLQTKEKVTAHFNEQGQFSFPALAVGKYTLMIEAAGFVSYTVKEFDVKQDEAVTIDAFLKAKDNVTVTVMVGVIASDPIDPSGTRTISGDTLRKLPIN